MAPSQPLVPDITTGSLIKISKSKPHRSVTVGMPAVSSEGQAITKSAGQVIVGSGDTT